MRRKDKLVTKIDAIKILDKCDVLRIAMCNNNIPYVVPMNFGYEYNDEKLYLYFHGAKEGKKIDFLKKNNFVCFEGDCSHKLVTGENACNYTMNYESIIGTGKIGFISDPQEKHLHLNLLMKKYTEKSDFVFDDKMMNRIEVLKLVVEEFEGKRSQR